MKKPTYQLDVLIIQDSLNPRHQTIGAETLIDLIASVFYNNNKIRSCLLPLPWFLEEESHRSGLESLWEFCIQPFTAAGALLYGEERYNI